MSLAAAATRFRRAFAKPDLPPLIFLHIPKTGGTSVARALSARYGPERSFSDNGNISVSLLTKHVDDIARGCFVHGHCEHGTLAHMGGAKLLTVLRRPEDHAISNYLYLRREPEQALHAAAMAHDFSAFYRTYWQMMVFQAISLDVAQSNMPVSDHASFFSRVPAIHALLDRIDFVGCLSDLDDFLRPLAGPRQPAPRLNQAPETGADRDRVDEMRAQYRALAQAPDTAPVLAVEQDLYERAGRRSISGRGRAVQK